jgi:anhydro-N-acetylmuramic acid kinase
MREGLIRVLGAAVDPAEGVVAAAMVTDGRRIAALGASVRRPLSAAEQERLAAAAGRWPGEPGVAEAAEVVETATAEALARLGPADLAGFAGLTLAHDPRGRGTHQAGDGALLAEALGLPVVWDMRAADVGLGGQGAPLAAFALHALARHLGADGPVAFLHLGRRARMVWADAALADPVEACLAFDAGPGPGEAGAFGRVDEAVLHAFVQDPFFARVPPKFTDAAPPLPMTDHLAPEDARATRAAAVAAGVVLACAHLPRPPARLWVWGPGRQDAALCALIAAGTDLVVDPVEAAGLDGAAIGAQAAAFAAARVARGLPTTAPSTTGVRAPTGGGVISRPAGPKP